jgi:hypothetical protein
LQQAIEALTQRGRQLRRSVLWVCCFSIPLMTSAAKIQSSARSSSDFLASSVVASSAHLAHLRANCLYSRDVVTATPFPLNFPRPANLNLRDWLVSVPKETLIPSKGTSDDFTGTTKFATIPGVRCRPLGSAQVLGMLLPVSRRGRARSHACLVANSHRWRTTRIACSLPDFAKFAEVVN